MTAWNAALYLRFADERTRPAAELLGRVPLETCRFAVDLGCGPGNSTELIAKRFPKARLLGLDNSPSMIAAARARLPGAEFALADIAAFEPETPPDLLFANAVLQWLPDHETLLPNLFSRLSPGGVLALQMPDNLGEPSHRAMRETAAEPRFREAIGDAEAVRTKLPGTDAYYDMLAPEAATLDIFRTTYFHVLDSPAAIVDWVSATGLRPFLQPLGEEEREAFLDAYLRRIAAAYPPRADGRVLLAFPRFFLVARRKDRSFAAMNPDVTKGEIADRPETF